MDRNRVVVSDYTKGISTNTNVQVFVRARPPAHQDDSKDLEALFGISARDPKRIEVKNRNTTGGVGEHAFNFDRVFWTQTRQEEIFASVCQQQVEHCVRGYNSCAFAYGQTGSGKTHTMFGEVERTLTNNPTSEHSSDLRGLVPRAVEYMFKQVPRLQMLLKDVKVECQFLEIYCDKIRDLGQAYNRKNNQLAATAAAGSVGAGGGGGGAAATGRDRTNSASSSRGEEPVTPTRALRTSKTALSWGNAPPSPLLSPSSRPSDGEVMTSDVYLMQQSRKNTTMLRGGPGHAPSPHGDNDNGAGGGGGGGGGSSAQRRRSGLFVGGVEGSDGEYLDMDLAIHEDQQGEVFVKDLTKISVSSVEDALAVVADGLKLRATHETKMNAVSSRSHTVFTLILTQTDRASGSGTVGKVNLVDLAGSERLKKSESEGMRLKEAVHINSSLTALGKVVMALDPQNSGSHVPYRDDKLTRVLQNSLGGNSYTTLVATIHPCEEYSEECLSTLQFANRCRVVQNQPRVMYTGEESSEAKDLRIKNLTDENKQLRKRLVAGGLGDVGEEESMDMFEMLGGGGGGDGGGGGGGGPMSKKQRAVMSRAANAMIIKILAELGITATIAEDGRVQLPDGRLVGHKGANGGEGGDSSNARSSGRNHGDDDEDDDDDDDDDVLGALMSGDGGASVARRLKALTREKNALKAKLGDAKAALDEKSRGFRRELEEQQSQLRQAAAGAGKDAEKAKRHALTTKEGGAAAMAVMAKAHSEQVKALVGRGEARLLEQHAKDEQQQRGMYGSGGGGKGKGVVARRSGERELASALEAHEQSKHAEMEHLKQQYEHWLAQRDSDLEKFVKSFNEYKVKSKARLAGAEGELLRVFAFARTTQQVLARIEQGEYPVRQSQQQQQQRGGGGGGGAVGRLVVPCVHPDHLPLEPHLLEEEVSKGSGGDGSGRGVGVGGSSSSSPSSVLDGLPLPKHLPSVRSCLKRKVQERKKAQGLAQDKHTYGLLSGGQEKGGGPGMGGESALQLLEMLLAPPGMKALPLRAGGASGLASSPNTAALTGPVRIDPEPRDGLVSTAEAARAKEKERRQQQQGHGRWSKGGGGGESSEDSSDDNSNDGEEEKSLDGTEDGSFAGRHEGNQNEDGRRQGGQRQRQQRRKEGKDGGGGGGRGATKTAVADDVNDELAQLDVDTVVARFGPERFSNAPRSELETALENLRLYVSNAVPKQVEQQVLKELQNSDTVQYMAGLEGRLRAKDATIADQAKKLTELRSAKEALTRAASAASAKVHQAERAARANHFMSRNVAAAVPSAPAAAAASGTAGGSSAAGTGVLASLNGDPPPRPSSATKQQHRRPVSASASGGRSRGGYSQNRAY